MTGAYACEVVAVILFQDTCLAMQSRIMKLRAWKKPLTYDIAIDDCQGNASLLRYWAAKTTDRSIQIAMEM
jgi:hypothetical protein